MICEDSHILGYILAFPHEDPVNEMVAKDIERSR